MNFLLPLRLVECPHPGPVRNGFVTHGQHGPVTTHLCMDCGSIRSSPGEFPAESAPTWRPWRRPRLAESIALDLGVKS